MLFDCGSFVDILCLQALNTTLTKLSALVNIFPYETRDQVEWSLLEIIDKWKLTFFHKNLFIFTVLLNGLWEQFATVTFEWDQHLSSSPNNTPSIHLSYASVKIDVLG